MNLAFAAIAMLLLGAVLLCLLPPLLRRDAPARPRAGYERANLAVLRDQARELEADLAAGTLTDDGHAAARQELAERVLDDVVPGPVQCAAPVQRGTALALALGLPVLAALLYLQVGTPAGLAVTPRLAGQAQHAAPASMEAAVDALAQRLLATPDDVEGLHMLARSYSALERYAESAAVYARLAALLPDEAGVLADYADALATAQGGKLKGEPERLVARALTLDAAHVKALSLAGSAAFERGDFSVAQQHWRAVLAQIPPDSEFARSTAASIAAAGGHVDGTVAPPQAATPALLTGTVRIAPALRAGLAPTDSVFIFARAPNGKGPPLAALRRQVRDLPLTFALDDSMGTGATAPLSQQAQVVVGARIARNGSATPAPGDPEGISAPVPIGTRDIVIDIASIRK